jgi:hypothetical protein
VNNAMYAACVRSRSQSLTAAPFAALCRRLTVVLCVVHRPLYPVTFDETNFAFVRLNKVALGKSTLELVFCDQSLNRLPGELVSFFLSILIPAGLGGLCHRTEPRSAEL